MHCYAGLETKTIAENVHDETAIDPFFSGRAKVMNKFIEGEVDNSECMLNFPGKSTKGWEVSTLRARSSVG